MNKYKYDEKSLETAIEFLVTNFKKSGNNPKPVIMHSIRVANLLWSNGASQNSVTAAILHDVLEDTDVTATEINTKFGKKVSEIVESLTFDSDNSDYNSKLIAAKKSYLHSDAIGIDALCVRAADLIDNSYYYEKNSQELSIYLKKKFELFIYISRDKLKGTAIWNLLEESYNHNVKNL